MKKFNVQDMVFLNEAIYAFLNEAEKFEKESKVLGKQPMITHSYGFHTQNGRGIIERIKSYYYEFTN